MGKLKFFGKAKRGAKKFSSLFTKSKHRTTRLPHSKKALKNKYPIIRKLKLSDCVPSTALGRLEQDAKHGNSDGAVQTVHLPNSSTLAYPVVVMSEKDMKKAGMTPKNGDLGYLSSSLSKDYIQPATLHADIQRGLLAIIPSDKSLENMESFDSLNKVKFHWGLFLSSLKDGSDSNQVIVLDNQVTLSQLINYSKAQPKMSLSGRKLVVDGASATSSINEPLKTNYDSDDARVTSSNSSDTSETATQNHTQQQAVKSPGQTLNTTGVTQPNTSTNTNQENNTANSPIPQGPVPNNPRAVQNNPVTSNTSTADNNTGNNQTTPHTNDTYSTEPSNQPQAGSNADTSASNESANSDYSDSDNDAVRQTMDDPDLVKAEQAAGLSTPDSDEDIGSRTALRHDPTEPTQSPKTYANDLKKFSSDAYYDNNLHIKLNLADIQKMLDDRPAPQLSLLKIKKGDKVAHLKHLLNIRITERNKKLRQLHQEHNTQIMDSARQLLDHTSDQLNTIVSPQNKASEAHRRYLKIKHDFQKAKNDQKAAASQATSASKQTYASLKSQYINAKASNAAAEFDEDHQRAHDAADNRTINRIEAMGQKDHISKVDSLNKWRRKVAKTFLVKALNQIKNNATNRRDSAYNDEKLFCDHSNKKIHKRLGKYYRDEIRRVNRVNYNDKHDHKIKQLRREKADTKKSYERKINTLKNDARQDQINAVKDQRDRMQAIIKNNQILRRHLIDYMHYARKAGNTLPPKYERELQLENKRVREIEQRNIHDRKRYNRDLNNMSQAFRRKTNSVDQMKSRFIWYGTGGGVLLAIVVLIGGIAIGHLTSSPQTHYVRESAPRSNGKDGGGNTTINNGNNQTPGSSKSSATTNNKNSKPQKNNSNVHIINRSLMTHRPPARHGLYIGTSTSHTPTSFMYVKHYHMYNKGDTIIGYKNNSKMHLKVTRVYKNMIFVKDPSNNVHYEFNVY